MISIKGLRPIDTLSNFYFQGNLDLDMISNAIISKNNEKFGLPIEISKDQVKAGNWLNPNVQDCLVVTNTEHKDSYLKYVIRVFPQGATTSMKCDYWGISDNAVNQAKRENRRGLSGLVMNAISPDKQQEYQVEDTYYRMFNTIILELANGW